MFVALAGGVGGARLAYGLSRVLSPDRLTIAVNTGDDFDHLGLSISPDIDTVCYTLAELDDLERGWGRAGETWQFMTALANLGGPGWFRLGDADLALHVRRTDLKASGLTLSEITAQIAVAMGIGCPILPMTDDRVATIVRTTDGPLAFQHYFVREQCRPVVRGFDYSGAKQAAAQPQLLDALRGDDLEGLILCPSNPWLSIGPIMATGGLGAVVASITAPRVVVSPIVGGQAIKGPAAKLMAELGLEVSALEIARHYVGLADAIVIDRIDEPLAPEIEKLGYRVLVTDTVMVGREGRIRLARELLGAFSWL